MTYLRIRRAEGSSFFEVVPLTYDPGLRDYREEAARIYGTSVTWTRALVPVGALHVDQEGVVDWKRGEVWELPRRRPARAVALVEVGPGVFSIEDAAGSVAA